MSAVSYTPMPVNPNFSGTSRSADMKKPQKKPSVEDIDDEVYNKVFDEDGSKTKEETINTNQSDAAGYTNKFIIIVMAIIIISLVIIVVWLVMKQSSVSHIDSENVIKKQITPSLPMKQHPHNTMPSVQRYSTTIVEDVSPVEEIRPKKVSFASDEVKSSISVDHPIVSSDVNDEEEPGETPDELHDTFGPYIPMSDTSDTNDTSEADAILNDIAKNKK